MLPDLKKIFFVCILSLTLFFSTSCGNNETSNIEIAGVKGPVVTLLQDNVLISFVFENIKLDGGLRYGIPKFPNSFIEISPDLESDGTLMQISTSLKDLLDTDVTLLDPLKLPGGRNLPGIPGGNLPAVAFSIEKFKNVSFYLGKEVFGVFVPVKVGVDGAIASFRYYIGQKRSGTISLVGSDGNGENSGVLLLLDFKGQVKEQLWKVYNRFN